MNCRCLIVDDEPPAIKVLENYIVMLDQLEIVATCYNALEAIKVLNSERIDLIFLDVNMPKLLGTQLLQSLSQPPKVIFTSAHRGYAFEAFELEAVDFLLKPISFERFLKAVNKYCQLYQAEPDKKGSDPGFIYFRSDRKMVKVYLEEILYIESIGDYILIHRHEAPELKVKQTLASAEELLPSDKFLRVHRSYIISLSKVTAFTRYEVEVNDFEIPFGRNYTDAALRLAQLQQGG